MRQVITVANMRDSDAYTIAHEVPSLELMYRAALGVYEAHPFWRGRIAIVAGSGNNGGDGYALACILADRGIRSSVYRLSDKFSPDGQYYCDLAEKKGVILKEYRKDTLLAEFDIIVDCILGTGFSGEVRGVVKNVIEEINASGAYVISVDINSGLNGDTGRGATAVRSDLTVSIGYLKPGMFFANAETLVGKLRNTDIGIRALREEYWLAEEDEIDFQRSDRHLGSEDGLTVSQEQLEKNLLQDETLPEAARRLAQKEGKLLRVAGRNQIVTDGNRVYLIPEDKELPKE